MSEEITNVSPEVVEPETTPENTPETPAEEGANAQAEQTPEVAAPEPQVKTKPKQSAEENAAFAAMRRQLEAERKEKAKYQSLVESLQKGLKHQGYDGPVEDIAARINAEALGITPEEYKAQLEADEKTRADLEIMIARLEEYERRERERQLEDDLKAIKKAFPDVKASSVHELGDKFLGIMATGTVDAVTAYRIVRESEAKPKPPSTGSLKSSGSAADKEFFTNEELDRLTPEQLDNPKILDKALKSLARLGK